MSRFAKTPITLPKGVELKTNPSGLIQIKGPKGALDLQLPQGLTLSLEGTVASLVRKEGSELTDAVYGLYRSLLKNHIVGTSEGYEIKLTLIGVGYKAAVVGAKLDLQLGFSHPTAVEIPKTVQVLVDKGTAISIKGVNKQEVGQFAASIRAMKPPEPYKGKGIRYHDEFVREKEGKAAKGKA